MKEQGLEGGPRDHRKRLTMREKDEGDLFGIRAIEAGYYAGVHQSRPSTRAGSVVDHPAMSSSTLVGDINSAFLKNTSANNSSHSLHTSQNSSDYSERRTSPPTVKLRPSEAELTGRHGTVDIPPRITLAQVDLSSVTPPTFGASNCNYSDDSRYALAPSFPEYYSNAPAVPLRSALRATDTLYSERGSLYNSTELSPTTVVSGLPILPATVYRQES